MVLSWWVGALHVRLRETSRIILNTPPQAQLAVTHNKLDLSISNQVCEIGFISTLAIWSTVDINLTSSSLWATFSYMKCTSISICFIRQWYIRFLARANTSRLSHQTTTLCGSDMPNSCNRYCNQVTSASTWAKALYLNLVLEWARILCFLEAHEIKFALKKMQ